MRHHPATFLRGGKANKSSVWDQKETDFIWNTPRKWLDSLVILNQHCNFQDQRVPTVLHPLISKVNFLTHEAEKLHTQLAMNRHVSKKTLPGKYSGAASINAASCLQPRCPISPLENLATAPLTSLTGERVEAGGALLLGESRTLFLTLGLYRLRNRYSNLDVPSRKALRTPMGGGGSS